jgi:tRNA(Ile)-lysidine synthase
MESLLPGYKESRFVVAFSGGADSLCLLMLSAGLIEKDRLVSATLDHGIRDGSAEETQKALEIAESLGVKGVSLRADIPLLSKERKKGVEEAGRFARYEFLERVRLEYGCDYILTGHQKDDLAETILGKLIRGGGPGASASIRGVSGKIIRPLLVFEANELRELLNLSNIKPFLDSTNFDLRYGRNYIRAKLMPLLLSINPKVKDALLRLSSISSSEEDFWEERLDRISETIVLKRRIKSDVYYLIEEDGFKMLHTAEKRRLIGRLLRRIPINLPGGGEPTVLQSAETALNFIESHAKGGLDLPGGRRVSREGLLISLGPASRLRAEHGTKAPLEGDKET